MARLTEVVERIELKLQEHGLKAAQASKLAGLSADAIRNLKRAVKTNSGRIKVKAGASTLTIEALAPVLRTTPAWLMGADDPDHWLLRPVKVRGNVGAGGGIDWFGEEADAIEFLEIPPTVEALIVRGDSQYPRFMDGEVILFDRAPVVPESLVGEYAVVQTATDARRLIKILRRNPHGGDNRWRLESHNAPPEDDVELLGAWRYVGVMSRETAAKPQGRKK